MVRFPVIEARQRYRDYHPLYPILRAVLEYNAWEQNLFMMNQK